MTILSWINIDMDLFSDGLNAYKIARRSAGVNSLKVKRLRRRQYDPGITEKTIGLVLGPSTAVYRLFLKHCNRANKAVETT